jgi:hypothetical protein
MHLNIIYEIKANKNAAIKLFSTKRVNSCQFCVASDPDPVLKVQIRMRIRPVPVSDLQLYIIMKKRKGKYSER